MRRRDLHVFHVSAAIGPLVFDPHIRKLNAVLVHRQVVLMRPVLNLVARAVRASVAVRSIAISLLEEPLVLTLELVIEDDAMEVRALCAKPFGAPQIGAEDLRVMPELHGF